METEDIIQIIAQVLTTAGLLFVLYEYFKSVKLRKEENYIQMEMKSLELFRLTIDYPELLKLYESAPKKRLKRKEQLRLSEYATSLLNMFEIQCRLRKKAHIDPVIFASWIPWIISLINGSFFRTAWKKELFIHYEPEFRKFIFDLVEIVDNSPGINCNHLLFKKASEEFNDCDTLLNWG